MIVSCPSCSTGYKLDEGRITGRGVRITCPKCKHVFVVYKDAPAQAMPKPTASASLLGEPAEDEKPADPDGPTSMYAGAAQPTPVAAASPAPPAPPAPAPAPPAGPVDVNTLDFRRVGIAAWKVKLRIGLVYDFNDFKTLSRYIAEGRVTAADRLSHDGKNWAEIGGLGDLESHFVRVYQEAEAAIAAASRAAASAAVEEFQEDEPTNIMGMAGMDEAVAKNLAAPGPSPLASFQSSTPARIVPGSDAPSPPPASPAERAASRGEPEGPRFVDPFEKRKSDKARPAAGGARSSASSAAGGSGSSAGSASSSPPRSPNAAGGRSKPEPKASGGRSGVVVAVVGLGLLIAGGAFFALRDGEPVAAPVPAPAPASAQAVDSTSNRDRVNEQIRKDLQPAEPEPASGPDDFGVEAEEQLIPVGPRGDGPGKRGGKSQNSGGSGNSTARDHAAVGDDALNRGDWSAAVQAFRKALSADPRNAVYSGKLGEALLRSGDSGGAMQPLMAGAQGGYNPAWRGLGNAAEAQGDRSGAIGYYQRYLSARPAPRDASQVQQRIDQLSGS